MNNTGHNASSGTERLVITHHCFCFVGFFSYQLAGSFSSSSQYFSDCIDEHTDRYVHYMCSLYLQRSGAGTAFSSCTCTQSIVNCQANTRGLQQCDGRKKQYQCYFGTGMACNWADSTQARINAPGAGEYGQGEKSDSEGNLCALKQDPQAFPGALKNWKLKGEGGINKMFFTYLSRSLDLFS